MEDDKTKIPEKVKEMSKEFGILFLYEATGYLRVIQEARTWRNNIVMKEKELVSAQKKFQSFMATHNLKEAELQ